MWQNKPRPNKTARLPYAYIPSEKDPLVLIPDPEVTKWVEDALDHLDEGHSCLRVAAWLVEKTGKKISHQGITNIWKEPDEKRHRKICGVGLKTHQFLLNIIPQQAESKL